MASNHKIKCDELVNYFYSQVFTLELSEPDLLDKAKDCAIFHIGQLLEIAKESSPLEYGSKEFYQEVLKCIWEKKSLK